MNSHLYVVLLLLVPLVICQLRPAVMNMVQYNGYWDCGRCLQKGILTHNIRIYKTIDSHSCHLGTRVLSAVKA